MKIIGIVGKSGSGKSTFASLLAQKLNCPCIDIDKIGHQASNDSKNLQNLVNAFGNEILNNDGSLNRKKLGAIVFENQEKMSILNDFTWNFMQDKLDSILKGSEPIIVLEWFFLPETKYWNQCDIKILVTADLEIRKQKILERDKISEEYFNKRESASISYESYEFDYKFQNDYQLASFEKAINLVINEISIL